MHSFQHRDRVIIYLECTTTDGEWVSVRLAGRFNEASIREEKAPTN